MGALNGFQCKTYLIGLLLNFMRVASDVREVKDACSKQSERISAVERAIVLVERYDGIFKKVFASVITSAILVAGSAVAYVMFVIKV